MKFVLVLILGALTGIAGWWTLVVREWRYGHVLELEQRDGQIAALRGTLAERDATIQQLETSLFLLKVDRRVARIEVLAQEELAGEPGTLLTRVLFVELGDDGEPLGAGKEIELVGSKIYLETLVIKFEDDYVEGGDFLRGASVCLFQRMFSENQAPRDGTEIDAVGVHPHTYGGGDGDGEADVFYAELWQRFWDYANDPDAAAAKGVRAIHGEAPFVEARPGKIYEVELRASGGLSITPR
jgi:hypothetical protein